MARYAFFNVASSASSVTDRTLRASTRLMAVAYYEISSAIFVITIVTHILGSLEAQRRARREHKTIHSSNAMAGKKARAREKRASAAMLTRPTRLTRAKPSPASPTTWSSLTFSDLSISTTTQISHGSQR